MNPNSEEVHSRPVSSASTSTASGIATSQATNVIHIISNDLEEGKKRYHDQSKEIVSCWRIAIRHHNEQLTKAMKALEEKIIHNDYAFRSFLITNPFGNLFYSVEYVSLCPKSSYALTLSAAKWPCTENQNDNDHPLTKDLDLKHDCLWEIVSGDEEPKVATIKNDKQKSDAQTTSTDPIEALHKTVSNVVLENALSQLLVKIVKRTIPGGEDFADCLATGLLIELASDHISKYFSPRDAAYCEWESGRDGK